MNKNRNNVTRERPQRIQPSPQRGPAAAAPTPPPPASSAAPEAPMPAPAAGLIGSDNPSVTATAPEAERGPGQRTRIPFGAAQSKLSYEPRPGFYRYWFRADPGRIDRAKAAGYDHVTDPVTGEPVSRNGGTTESGGSLDMYLMEQPMNWHEEDVAASQRPVDEIDHAIKHGAVGKERVEDGTRYQPEGRGIKISAR